MKHLIFTTDFKPMPGGVAEYLHKLATHFPESEDVGVLAHGVREPESGQFPYEVVYTDAPDRALGECLGDGHPLVRRLNDFLYLWGPARRAAEEVLAELFDRHAAEESRLYVGLWNSVSHWWCRWLEERGLDYGVIVHGLEVVSAADSVRESHIANDLQDAAVVYTNSEATASLVERKLGIDETVVAYPGVDAPERSGEVDALAAELESNYGVDESTPVLLTVGRLERRKGVHKVLQALTADRLRDRRVRYFVAGAGPEFDRFRRLASELGVDERVEFLGFVDDDTKWALYQLADIFVMPNSDLDGEDWEGFGIVFLEAAMMETPSIAGRAGGAAEAVADGESGLVVDPESPSELEEAIVALLDDPERARELGIRARKRAREKFTWERTVGVVRSRDF